MAKQIAVVGGSSKGAGAGAVGAAVKKIKEARPTGNPTPESIARRKWRNLKRRLDSIAGWRPFVPNGRTGPEIQSSTRGDRRRAKLGRA